MRTAREVLRDADALRRQAGIATESSRCIRGGLEPTFGTYKIYDHAIRKRLSEFLAELALEFEVQAKNLEDMVYVGEPERASLEK